MYPKILIQYNRFLDPIFDAYIKAQPQWKDWQTPPKETVMANIEMYKQEWGKYGDIILAEMCRVTGLSFRRNEIDVYIVSGNPRSFSRPIVLKSRYSPTDFINVLTHELIHALLSDNDFSKRDPFEEGHIAVFAVMKHILVHGLDKPEYAFLAQVACAGQRPYMEAWEYVEKEGYKQIIRKAFGVVL